MDTTKLIAIVGLILSLSVASERLVDIIKGFVTPLVLVYQDPLKEARRHAAIHALAVAVGVLTAFLAKPVIAGALGVPEPSALWIVALGVLASGGSSLWNSILGYLLSVKDIKVSDAAKVKTRTA